MDGHEQDTRPLHLTEEEMKVVFMCCNTYVSGMRLVIGREQPGKEARAYVERCMRVAEGVSAAIADAGVTAV